jgi:hypothetical protein
MGSKAVKLAGKIAALYESGALTCHEAVTRLVLLAAEEAPTSLADALPEELSAQIREISHSPPADPGKSPRIFGIGVSDEGAWREHTSRAWYEGAWAWHHHFYGEPGAVTE